MAILHDYSGGITETAVIASHREIITHKESMKTAQGQLREARKRAIESGMDPKAYDLAVKLAKMDEVDAASLLNKAYFYVKAMRAPIGAQLNFIDLVTDNANLSDEERAKRWYDEGYAAGINGKGQDTCRHGMNLPGGQAWLSGWQDAQAELAKGFKPLHDEEPDEGGEESAEAAAEAAKAEETPKRRGRPPGSGAKRKTKEVEAADTAADDVPIAPADGWGASGGTDSYGATPAAPPPPPPVPDDDEPVPFDDGPPPPPSDAPAFVH